MSSADQEDITDPQNRTASPGDAQQASIDNNDENNNNIVSNSENINMAADQTTAPEIGGEEEKEEGQDPVPAVADGEADQTVADGTSKLETGEAEINGDQVNIQNGEDVEEDDNLAAATREPEVADKDNNGIRPTDQEMANTDEPPAPNPKDEGKDKEEISDQHAEPEVTADDAADAKSDAESNAGGSLVPTPTPATKIRLNARKHTTTPADDSGLAQPVLPTINKGQANVHQMTTSITHARRKQDGLLPISRQPVRSRVPPKLVRLATVTVSPAKSRPNKTASLYYEEPRRPSKVITWDQATNHRPPLRIDMEGPGPCSYSPLNKPLGETNAPCFTFGTKCYPEKDGGARTSWGKSWFQSSHLWHNKADYAREGLWPSPNHYPKPALLGPRQRTMPEAPSYTFGHKAAFSIVKPGAAKEPSPNDYERQNADSLVLRRGPSFTHQFRREGTVLWGSSEKTPAPCSYAPDRSPRVQRPAYTIQGIRREKSHVLGPYSTL
ncbi:protein STPG3 [Elysia marginata]|uniref:Protein STPG3 n=1 Tax=Elysia marginata TaxID=1093978 RepID=A0AAV4GNG5_9GAST|nr:protein STPG3 [Elysia marginata]